MLMIQNEQLKSMWTIFTKNFLANQYKKIFYQLTKSYYLILGCIRTFVECILSYIDQIKTITNYLDNKDANGTFPIYLLIHGAHYVSKDNIYLPKTKTHYK